MIETLCLAAGSLIQLGGASISLQTQAAPDTFWDKMIPVLIGGLITLIVNIWIQERLFYEQRDAREMDQRLDAYRAFLRASYVLDHRHERIQDLSFSANMVMRYGSDDVKRIIRPGYDAQNHMFNTGMPVVIESARNAMYEEIENRPRYNRPWWISLKLFRVKLDAIWPKKPAKGP